MNLKTSVERLEQAVNGGDDETCGCRMRVDVRRYPGEDSEGDAGSDTTPAQRCAFCGKPKLILKVVYTRHWRREDEAA